jgi:hypothetical protein
VFGPRSVGQRGQLTSLPTGGVSPKGVIFGTYLATHFRESRLSVIARKKVFRDRASSTIIKDSGQLS